MESSRELGDPAAWADGLTALVGFFTYMARKLTQDTRICELITPLGKDVLVFTGFEATEGLSELFEFHIECLSENDHINFDKAIGKQCTLKMKMHGKERQFSGILVEAQWLGPKGVYFGYRILLRPWLWLLSRTSDCRIFQDKKASDIIKEVFQDRGFTDVESKLTEDGQNPKLEYCVQYRETDLNFVSRLMEQHGIYYFFKHEGDKHTLVLADSKSSHAPVDGLASIPYVALTGSDRHKEQLIHSWTTGRRFRTGKIELNDYNYQKPNAQMVSDAQGSEAYTRSQMEMYDYPGKYIEKKYGERYAKIRLQSEQALDHRTYGNGEAVNLFPGGLTKLERHWQDLAERRVSGGAGEAFICRWRPIAPAVDGGRQDTYFGSYEFLPSKRPFRAPIVTPKPLINGIQTAKVVTKGRQFQRGNRRREARRDLCPLPLGSKKEALLPPARCAGLVGQGLGRSDHPARRPGGRHRISRRRSGPSAGDRHRLQRRIQAALRVCPSKKTIGGSEVRTPPRTAAANTTSGISRTRKAPRRSPSTPRRTLMSSCAIPRPAPSVKITQAAHRGKRHSRRATTSSISSWEVSIFRSRCNRRSMR